MARGGTPHMKGVGMLVGNFELNPKMNRSRRGPSFLGPLKETILKHRQMKNVVTFNDGKDIKY